MSEFQTSLVVIGALVIAAVFAYNKWQEHRAGREADENFRSEHPDALIGAQPPLSPRAEPDGDSRVEPVLAPRVPPQPEARPARDTSAVVMTQPFVDYVIEIDAQEAAGMASLPGLWEPIEHRFGRRASLTGWGDGEWQTQARSGTWQKLRAAFQLVGRQGVAGEAEVIEFRSEVETLASKLGARASAPEMRDALEEARKLDALCAEADIQVAFHVIALPGNSFPGTKIRAAAEASGFVLDEGGRFTLADENGHELYTLADRNGARFTSATMKDATPQALTLSMDVPRAPDTQRTFDAMVRFGRHLANLLGGALVDDNNQPLDEKPVAAISAQLVVVRQALEENGITPGSDLALRLFS